MRLIKATLTTTAVTLGSISGFPENQRMCKQIRIQSLTGAGQDIMVGDESQQAYQIDAGEEHDLFITNIDSIYVKSDASTVVMVALVF